jgi:hypothetical protein
VGSEDAEKASAPSRADAEWCEPEEESMLAIMKPPDSGRNAGARLGATGGRPPLTRPDRNPSAPPRPAGLPRARVFS